MSLEGGERDAALVRLVAVVDQVAGHADERPSGPRSRHRGRTLIPDPDGAAPVMLAARDCTLAKVLEHLVGRAAELEPLERRRRRTASGESRARSC